jgi:hypothetical protein
VPALSPSRAALSAIEGAWLAPNQRPSVDLRYDVSRHSRKNLLDQLASVLSGGAEVRKPMPVAAAAAARDRHGVVRYRRYAGRITGWFAERQRLGSIRLRNPVLYRKRALCEAIERELMSVLGVDRYDTNAMKCRVDIEYDPRQISAAQLVEILDSALAAMEHPAALDKINRELTICSASLPLAAVAQFAVLAAELGMDRYFAQVLPTEKADYVEKLQKEGRKVCFVGDGINDAIALKKANVSISLRGAILFGPSIAPLPALAALARDSVARVGGGRGGSREAALSPNNVAGRGRQRTAAAARRDQRVPRLGAGAD